MPSSKGYLSYIMEQLAPLEGITTRQMMGEYIICLLYTSDAADD